MTFATKLFSVLVLAVALFAVACGPTYVQPVAYQQQQYNPGYDPNQFLYDAMLADAIFNGQHGYWGPGHVFYPMVTVGGVGGYYDSGHHFHTSVTNKTVVINNYNHGREEFVKTHPPTQQSGKPNYTSTQNGGQGTIGRGSPQASQTPTGKPNYTSSQNAGQGTIGRGAAQTQAPSKPNYTSSQSQGTIQRSAPAAAPARSYSAPSRPSYSSSSSGSMGRRK